MSSKLILAIDFDNTIHDIKHPVAGRKMGEPMEGAKSVMTRWKRQGHTLIIHSVMATNPSGEQAIRDWLRYYHIPFDKVTAIKPLAAVYLDDRALKFTSWDKAYKDIMELSHA